jgi:hypothetical protein
LKTLALDVRDTLVPSIDDQYLGRPYAAPPNFVKISGAHRMTPAMAADVESRLWEIGDIVKVVEAWEAALG